LGVKEALARLLYNKKINLTTYCIDFGMVILGQPKKKTFKVINTGPFPLEFNLDPKYYKNLGFVFTPDKGK